MVHLQRQLFLPLRTLNRSYLRGIEYCYMEPSEMYWFTRETEFGFPEQKKLQQRFWVPAPCASKRERRMNLQSVLHCQCTALMNLNHFTFLEHNFAGPFLAREESAVLYIPIWTSVVTRALHLEIDSSLATGGLWRVFKRLIASGDYQILAFPIAHWQSDEQVT